MRTIEIPRPKPSLWGKPWRFVSSGELWGGKKLLEMGWDKAKMNETVGAWGPISGQVAETQKKQETPGPWTSTLNVRLNSQCV